ncbi:MAG: hypothetical protein L0220_01165 [Acidobacteria bacterium]|nr:hypothetical protein [Acidobacteriota bacterium]
MKRKTTPAALSGLGSLRLGKGVVGAGGGCAEATEMEKRRNARITDKVLNDVLDDRYSH